MSLDLSVPGNLGNIVGAASDGVLIGQLTPTDPDMVLLKGLAQACLCITDDGGLYVDETTAANNATADDVEIVGTTLLAGDAIYIGHATKTFADVRIEISTRGVYTDPVLAFKYWNGTAWTALSGVVDGTTAFEAAAGNVAVTFTLPTDWAKNTVDSVSGYWLQISVTSITASVTPMQIQQIWVIASAANGTWTDDTTDFTDIGAADVILLPAFPVIGDGLYVGYSEKFCKVKVTTSTARVGTATLAMKYWNGTAWAALATVEDDSAGWSTAAGTHFIHFTPPTAWVANTAANGPNGEAGFFVVMELTAITDVTTQPVATQGWVYPLVTGASGVPAPSRISQLKVTMSAQTSSGAAADSKFLVVNTTTGVYAEVVWTKADPLVTATVTIAIADRDEISLVQITEDGTTEFADATFNLQQA